MEDSNEAKRTEAVKEKDRRFLGEQTAPLYQ
jgi:hypothetical protein